MRHYNALHDKLNGVVIGPLSLEVVTKTLQMTGSPLLTATWRDGRFDINHIGWIKNHRAKLMAAIARETIDKFSKEIPFPLVPLDIVERVLLDALPREPAKFAAIMATICQRADTANANVRLQEAQQRYEQLARSADVHHPAATHADQPAQPPPDSVG